MINFFKKQPNIKSLLLNKIYILNISLPTLIFGFFFLSKYYDTSVNYMLVASLSLFLSFSLSGNFRQTLVADNNIEKCKKVLGARIIKAIVIFILSFLAAKFIFNINNISIILLGSLTPILIWINEINLIILEIKKDFKNIFFKFLFSYVSLFLLFICFFFLKYDLIFILSIVFIVIFFFQNFDFDLDYKYLEINRFRLVFGFNYISSICLNLSSFLFKYQINYFLEKKNTAFLFFCITIGSSLATITFNSIGPKDFNENTKFTLKFIFLLFLYIAACILIYILQSKGIIFEDFISFADYVLVLSALGGLIFTISYIYRQNILSKIKYRKRAFLLDIIFAIFVVVSVPILYFLNKDYINYSYLITSIFSFLIFYFYYNFAIKKR
tara:strand:- start:3146 stop:4297 length:1152 start_codon:yes stop_codon:yes gene_type:complete